MLKDTLKRLFPRGTKRFIFIKRAASYVGLAKPYPYDHEYERWVKWIEPDIFAPTLPQADQKNLFSIVIPFYNTPDKYLLPLINSIRAQSYQNWELVMADASTDDERARAIKELAKSDKRLKYHKLQKNAGISANTNEGLKLAKGEFVVFCDHDDTLNPHALNEVATALKEDPTIDIFYSDEDKLSDNGRWRHSPYFKPDWSPHLFLNTNYTNHLSVVRRKLVEGVKGLRPDFDGSQDYDLLLRIHRKYGPVNVYHIDKILYHWREAAGSTAINHNSKSYAFEAGRKALQEYVDAGSIKGVVTNINKRPGFYNHKFTPAKTKTATVCIQISDDEKVNQTFLRLLKDRTDARNIKCDYVHSERPTTLEQLADKHKTDAVFIFREVALPHEGDWLVRLCGALELGDIAKIAPRILNSDLGIVYDMGIMNDNAGNEVQLYRGLAANDQTVTGHVEWVVDVERLSGAIEGMMTQKSKDIEEQYSVVWSYVNFRHVPLVAKKRMLSMHVNITPKGKIKVNGKL